MSVAIGNANEDGSESDQQLLLVPLTELIEVFLSEVEGNIPSGSLLRVLEDARGHFVVDAMGGGPTPVAVLSATLSFPCG